MVNALWDGRLAVDAASGVAPERRWLYRLKHYVRVRAPSVARAIPSTTVVLGPYGDVVSYGNGEVYLSWYPAGMLATSSEIVRPPWRLSTAGAGGLGHTAGDERWAVGDHPGARGR